MKKFNELKIAGCFMAHDENPEYMRNCLNDLSRFTNELYVNFNEPTEEVKQIVMNHSNLKKYIFTENSGTVDLGGKKRWNQGEQRTNTVRLLDEVKPDLVLFPDTDEIYPDNMQDLLKEFWEDETKLTMWFRLFYMWNDKDHFRNDKIWKSIHHVRAYKWKEGLTYRPYRGYAVPTNYAREPKETRYNSLTPIKHYGYMTNEDRQKKYLRNDCDYSDPQFKQKSEKEIIIRDLPNELREKRS